MVFGYFRPERRYARRLARAARWDRPIASAGQRFFAWGNMLLADHGLFRLFYLNVHQVTPDLWRSAQPAPHQIARWAQQRVRTVVTLRGGREFGCWPLEREACESHGLNLVEFTARSREAPTAATILAARELFARLEYPAVLHCKSGADRAGFMAALYLILKEGRTADEALGQLSWRYGHWRWSKTGVLDAFIEAYREGGEKKGKSLVEWVAMDYDPAALTRSFKPGFWSNILVDRVLRRE
jgi:protein tyrosine/serine phosphatase